MSKRNARHNMDNARKMLDYGVQQGFGAFRRRPTSGGRKPILPPPINLDKLREDLRREAEQNPQK